MDYTIPLLIIGYFLTKCMIPLFIKLLVEANCLRNNYRNEKIPVSLGLVFVPISVFIGMVGILLQKNNTFILVSVVGILAMGLAGLLDDLLGNRDVTGLKGHLQSLLKGRLTTGAFKAVFGGGIALFISIIVSQNLIEIFVNTLLIALFTNFINLLDLRPGRALKGFFLSSVILLFFSFSSKQMLLFGSIFGGALAYFPYDLKARSMMGDVGSNILGVSLGILAASIPSIRIRSVFLIFLVLIHIYTEKYSLTRTIEKNRFLKFIDNLGR